MRGPVQIENIEEMRRRAGIDDVELRETIRGLRVGDRVNLTVLKSTTSCAWQTLRVRITRIRGSSFRGLVECPGRFGPGVGARLAFTAAHIHSVPEGRPPHAP
jgi:hypothetical protein